LLALSANDTFLAFSQGLYIACCIFWHLIGSDKKPQFLAVDLTKLDVLGREWDERLIKTFYKIAANYGNS